jgi:hypothetical protein
MMESDDIYYGTEKFFPFFRPLFTSSSGIFSFPIRYKTHNAILKELSHKIVFMGLLKLNSKKSVA